MAHEITSTDNVVLHKEGAWHGLGIVIPEEMTPREALVHAGMDWIPEQRTLVAKHIDPKTGETVETEISTHVANYRSDTGEFLGMVSSTYQPVPNADLADFCEALLEEGRGTVKIETAGSIRGGKRVWFLLKGAEFEIANGDGIFPYLLASNGHDGWTPCRLTPTSVRAVCSNTLHQCIPYGEDNGETLGTSAICIKHTRNIMDRLEEARTALKMYSVTLEKFKKTIDGMSKVPVNFEQIKSYFFDRYTADFGMLEMNPTDRAEERRLERAQSAFTLFHRRFDDEKEIAGASAWNMFNAYSGLIQNDRKTRGKNDVARYESRVESNLLGLNQDRTLAALRQAYSISRSAAT